MRIPQTICTSRATRLLLVCSALAGVMFLLGATGAWDPLRVYRTANECAQNVWFSGNTSFSVAPQTDAIAEKTGAAGVTVDGLLIKDGAIAYGNVTGLGTMATQNANAVAITGGNVTAITNLGASNATITGGTVSGLTSVGVGNLTLSGGNITSDTGTIDLGTNVTATTFSGAFVGGVTGNVTGDITGSAATLLGSTWAAPAALGSSTPANVTAADLLGLVVVTGHNATGNITAAECKGGISTNTGAGGAIVLTLPDATVGRCWTGVLTVAADMDVNPQDTDTLVVPGLAALVAGDAISSDATIGTRITFICLVAGYWHSLGGEGTWTDVD